METLFFRRFTDEYVCRTGYSFTEDLNPYLHYISHCAVFRRVFPLDFLDSFIWILTVTTTIIHNTNLQHINQRLVFWFGITSLLT
jgi:hypothetical protein